MFRILRFFKKIAGGVKTILRKQNLAQILFSNSYTSKSFILKYPYHARSDWLEQRALSENIARVDDSKLAFKFLFRNFDCASRSIKDICYEGGN